MGWLHEHKHMGQGRPPDDALQASLVSAADPQAAGDHARLGLIRRALDQGQEVRLWIRAGMAFSDAGFVTAWQLGGVGLCCRGSCGSAASAYCEGTTLALSACEGPVYMSPGRYAVSPLRSAWTIQLPA